MLVMVDFGGVVVNGAERWLQVLPGFRLQPSELMKIAVPLALARYYHQSFSAGPQQPVDPHRWPSSMVMIPVALVLRQPDLGTALMILGTGCAVIFFAGISLRLAVSVIALVALMVPVVYFFALHDYQRQRIETMFNPEADPLGAGYQLQQGLIAIGSGGLAGKGFMEGAQKELDYIPEQHTDFIFTIVAEEFGFVGALVMLRRLGHLPDPGHADRRDKSRSTFEGLAAAGFRVDAIALCRHQYRHGDRPASGGGHTLAAYFVWRHGYCHSYDRFRPVDGRTPQPHERYDPSAACSIPASWPGGKPG